MSKNNVNLESASNEVLERLCLSLSSRSNKNDPDHRVDFHNPEVIGSDNNWRRLQILEFSLIQEQKPELNANIPSMSLKFFKSGGAALPASYACAQKSVDQK